VIALDRAPDRVAFEATVVELRALERKSGLERMVSIGRLVLNRFFGGSPAAWRERRRNKNNSVRRLAKHPGCPFSHSSLNQALGVYVTVSSLPCVQTFEHCGASHVIAVLHLPLDAQASWLQRAECERWSVRDLKAAVLTSRRLEGERRGRPKGRDARAIVARVRRATEVIAEALNHSEGLLLNEHDGRELRALCVRLSETLRGHAHLVRAPRELFVPAAADQGLGRPLRATGS
jgi:hypothetical protein